MDSPLSILKQDISNVDEIVHMLDQELLLFDRNMYKNHSQHRRAPFYQYLQEVKRCFRDLDTLKLKNLFEETDKAANAMQLSSTMHHLSWKVLSTELKVTVDKFLRQHVGFSQSIAKTIRAIQKAYKALSAQFTSTFFMPFTLVMNSVLGRLTVLLKTLLIKSIEAHGCISLVYLSEVTKANPLRASVTALQLFGYKFPPAVLELAHI